MTSPFEHAAGRAQDAFLCRGGSKHGGRQASKRYLSPEAKLQASMMTWRYPGSDACWDPESVRTLLQQQASTALAQPLQAVGGQGSRGGTAATAGGGGGAGGAVGVASVLSSRLASWRLALRSVYLRLRSGACPSFYVTLQVWTNASLGSAELNVPILCKTTVSF